MTARRFVVEAGGARLDRFLADRCAGLSRSQLQKLVQQGMVAVKGRPAKPGLKLEPGDEVTVRLPEAPGPLVPEQVPLDIVHQDDHLIVVDKPAGMTVHPAAGQREHTLVNALLARFPSMACGPDAERPGIVHRLDKDTSGLMVVARTEEARQGLVRQFRSRSVDKVYTALVAGHLSPELGVIEAPIGRDPAHRKRMAVVEGGKEARTRYRVLRYLEGYTLVEAAPETGRTHQIRVHFTAIGYPVAGDAVYGRRSSLFPRQFLHASRLAFPHPVTSRRLDFTSSLPQDLRQALDRLRPGPTQAAQHLDRMGSDHWRRDERGRG